MVLKYDIINFLSDKLLNKNAIIGISGGIDSSLVLTLLSNSVSNDKIIPIFLPDNKTPREDFDDVSKICKFNNISFKTIHIDGILHEYKKSLDMGDEKTIGNLKARIRMTILYSIANLNNGLVIGTTNKSEYITGYFTKYGDGACDLEPIIGLYKKEVWELSAELGLPESIIRKKPSARLWEGQTDEEDMGISYKELDTILTSFQDNGEFTESAEGNKVSNLYRSSMHKRRMPYSPGEESGS
ncbi:MAG: NAD+ synthase [Thermoplasmataceae archaeon]